MTKENAHEYLPLVQALAEGKTIEMMTLAGQWLTPESFSFDLSPDRYRIKPEKKLLPFTWEDRELLRGKWCVKLKNDDEMMITQITEYGVNFGNSKYSYTGLMVCFTFLDGSPCGKEVEG